PQESHHEMDWNVSFWLYHLYWRRYGRAMEVGNSRPYRYDLDRDRSCDRDRDWHYGLSLKQWHQGKYRNQPEVKNVSIIATVRVACRPGLSNRCSCRLLWRRQIS